MRKLVRQAAPRFTTKLQPAPCLCRDPELARQTLRIPRRPEWTEDMTAAELNQLENEAFLKWRAQIAMCVCGWSQQRAGQRHTLPCCLPIAGWSSSWQRLA